MVYFIAKEEMYAYDGTKVQPIRCSVWDHYVEFLHDSARRNDWKNTGTSAQFQGRSAAYESAQTRLMETSKRIHSLCPIDGRLHYSMSIDEVSGIYACNENAADSVVISDKEYGYESFCASHDGTIAVSVSYAGEAHIGWMKAGERRCRILTEGQSRERRPSFSKKDPDTVLCESVGLAVYEEPLTRRQAQQREMMLGMGISLPPLTSYVEGNSAILSVNLKSGAVAELMGDESMQRSYLQPTQTANGAVYFLRAPYEKPKRPKGAIARFFTPGNKSELIMGPGNVPCILTHEKKKAPELRSAADLCVLRPDGLVQRLYGGVMAYAVVENGIYVSDGKQLLFLDWREDSPKVCVKEAGITAIYAEE